MTVDQFVELFSKAVRDDNAAIFAGAGLSSGAGFVNWAGLLKDVAEELHLDVGREQHDLVGLAQFYCNQHGNRGRLNQIITDEFQRRAVITENHRLLAKLPISTYWTTNYDTLIETALVEAGKVPDIKREPENLAITVHDRDAVVYKMHGDVSQVHKAIINRDDYERYELTHSVFTTALQGDLVSKTFLFIGFSFADPNLNYVLSRIRSRLGENQRPHFCFLKKVSDAGENSDYERIRQEHQINDLKRFSINTILVDEYSDITAILKRIEQRYRMNTVFVSGSAEVYGAFGEQQTGNLLHDLSKRLIQNKHRVVSGFGVGIGSFVINGAIEQLKNERIKISDEHLVLRPFPQVASGGNSLPELWDAYRRNILQESGIAIFFFGNKKAPETGQIIDAAGVQKEFDIAVELGVKVIPVGSTGYQSKVIYDCIMNDFERYYPNLEELRTPFEVLGHSNNNAVIIDTIMQIIAIVRRKQNG